MARPVRSAAEKARELIARGYGIKEIDAIGAPGMDSDEEDDLNAEIAAASAVDINFVRPDLIDERSRSPIDEQPDPRFKTYKDVDMGPSSGSFKPSKVPGPHLAERITRQGAEHFTTALDFFQLFFDDAILESIVENTNLYAWVNILDRPSYSRSDGAWEPTSIQEIKNFIAYIIFNGFAGRSNLERNWSQATMYSGGWSRRFLSKNRFKALNGFLHLMKPGEEDPRDKLAKLRPLIDHIRRCCKTFFYPERAVSVDERMVASKGRSPIKQFMPDKPARFGYKLWCICDSATGYTCDFSVYTGRSEGRSQNGLGYDVVTSLSSTFLNRGHHIYCDSFFTSVHLADSLLANGTFMCGTMQHWRRGFPEILKDKSWVKKVARGDMRYVREDRKLFVQWMDNNAVNMLTTIHTANGTGTARRRGKNKAGVYKPVTVRIPLCIHDYNQKMGGVDLADQMIETYNCLMKSTRWWKTLFFHMVDVAILNSFVLFKLWRELNPEMPALHRCVGYSHLEFREELARQLARISPDEDTPLYYPAFKRRKSLNCSGPHNPTYTSTRRNCHVCYLLYGKQLKSYIKCSEPQCQVHLCLNASRNCFPIWHSQDFDKYRGKDNSAKR